MVAPAPLAAYRGPMSYVSVGRRFLAILIDSIIGIAWTYPFLTITRSPGYYHAELGTGGFLGSFAITLLYFTVMEGLFGATVGKFVTGIRVVREDGRKLDLGAAVIRNISRIVDQFPYVVPYLVGAIAVWTSPTRQRLGDRWASTVVVTATSVGAAQPPSASATWMPPGPGSPGVGAPPPMPPPPPLPVPPGGGTPPAEPVAPVVSPGPPAGNPVPPSDPAPEPRAEPAPPAEPTPPSEDPPPSQRF
jgi:uncharacterized RDD family membrane protein YckC